MKSIPKSTLMNPVRNIRSFSRFYTSFLGLLNKHILDSPLSLTESRILFEIGTKKGLSASELISILNVDKGYLSRILRKFEDKHFVARTTSRKDGRIQILTLEPQGAKLFDFINRRSERQWKTLTRHLSPLEMKELAGHLMHAQLLLERGQGISLEDIEIRTTLKPGDLGFVIHSHGELYDREYGYGRPFENYVARDLLEFVEQYEVGHRNKVWVCEHNERKIGFLLLMDRGDAAQLRFFFIYPEYRGIGLGKRLMNLYMEFMYECGYTKSFLWTTNELKAAAWLYKKKGFVLVEEKRSVSFGKPVIEQKYELILK